MVVDCDVATIRLLGRLLTSPPLPGKGLAIRGWVSGLRGFTRIPRTKLPLPSP
jgi:hypothetical protein